VPGIFVNYRRVFLHTSQNSDHSHAYLVEALADRLRRHFGDDDVFLDVESLSVGDVYPERLRHHLANAEVLLVVIGGGWLEETRHRMGLAGKDWVRFEIAEALRNSIPIVQVVLDDVVLPAAGQLPEDIQEMAMRQVFQLRGGRFAGEVSRLIALLQQHVGPKWQPPPIAPQAKPSRWRVPAAHALTLALALVLPSVALFSGRRPSQQALIDVSHWPALGFVVATMVFAAIYRWRRRLDDLQRITAELPPAVSLVLLDVPFTLGLVGTGTIMMAQMEFNDPDERAVLTFVGGTTLLLGAIAISVYYYNKMTVWPPDIDVPGGPRTAIARVRQRLELWGTPLNRTQRDQIQWFRSRLAVAADNLRQEALRTRRERLLRPSLVRGLAVGLMLYLVYVPLTGIFLWDIQQRSSAAELIVGVAVIALFIALGVIFLELVHRFLRWEKTEIAAEVTREMDRLDNLLNS